MLVLDLSSHYHNGNNLYLQFFLNDSILFKMKTEVLQHYENLYYKWQCVFFYTINRNFGNTHLHVPFSVYIRGGFKGGGAHRAPPKIAKNTIFWRKIVIFPLYIHCHLR